MSNNLRFKNTTNTEYKQLENVMASSQFIALERLEKIKSLLQDLKSDFIKKEIIINDIKYNLSILNNAIKEIINE